ncbi:hypothetical protein [Kribbella swartbergensis]
MFVLDRSQRAAELNKWLVRSTDARYFPNRIHGDELVRQGATYTESNEEWAYSEEIENLLTENSTLPLVMVDRSELPVAAYKFRLSGLEGWSSIIKPRYITDDGFAPPGRDFYFTAHMWGAESGERLLLFELEC